MNEPENQLYIFGPFRLNVGERMLLRDGEQVPLPPKAFDLLVTFVQNPNRLLTKDELLNKVWPGLNIEEGNLALNISMLRRALGSGAGKSDYFQTVARGGYRFVADVYSEAFAQDIADGVEFSETVRNISPAFVTIYRQATIAEREGLLELCEVGYRNALEVLIKDYAIRKYPTEETKIINKSLAACLYDYIDDDKIKNLATHSSWLDDHESHFHKERSGTYFPGFKIFIFVLVHFFDTQAGLAQNSGLSQSEVSKIGTTHFQGLNEETIRRLSKGLEITPEVLSRGTRYASLFGQSEILPFGLKDDTTPFTAYFSCALTGLRPQQMKEIFALDEKVNGICKRYNSYPVALYRPRIHTSPAENADISAHDVYESERERVAAADLLIFAATFPSFGAGMLLQLAHYACSSVILLRKKGQNLSRMVTGCPVRMFVVEYINLNDLEHKLVNAFDHVLPNIAQARLLHHRNIFTDHGLGERIRQVREQRKLSQESLARMVGVDTLYIQALESKPEQVANPSLLIIRRVAKALHVSESYLISGYAIPIHQTDPIFSRHYEALVTLARKENMTAYEFETLWKTHVEKYQVEMSVLGAGERSEVGDRKYWIEQYERLQKKASGRGGLH